MTKKEWSIEKTELAILNELSNDSDEPNEHWISLQSRDAKTNTSHHWRRNVRYHVQTDLRIIVTKYVWII